MWATRQCLFVFYFFVVVCGTWPLVDCKKNHYTGKQALKFLKSHHRIGHHVRRNATHNTGLWPSVFNLATKAEITSNATCGETGREEFCRMMENGKGRCGVCDNFSPDPGKRHSITFAIDGSHRWWQSPALYYGTEYEYVTIVIDLKQIYQIAYIIIKAANSPRPGLWILEKSTDGIFFDPWQYYARNDKECLDKFGIQATKGKPHFFTDSEVICTSFYSRLTPTENGEVHTSLIHGRPGANESSPELLEFTKARYVRIRLMGLRGTLEPVPRWFLQDIWRDKRLYYSIRDISIGGQCVCNGHAENCRHNVASGHPECECSHHTCGPNCEKCCPMYNQRQWAPGTSRDGHRCLPCNCHGHATSCHYDQDVDRAGLSLDIHGTYQGGGVCDNCTSFTAGLNCEQCVDGYYRPAGVLPDAEEPCIKCQCDPLGSTGLCVQQGDSAGDCECNIGYAGEKCDRCDVGYRGYPKCDLCPCDPKGVEGMGDCEGDCVCKANVEGKYCDRCKSGFFGLNENHPEGCRNCFCSGVTTLCESAIISTKQIQVLKEWFITDLRATKYIKPVYSEGRIFSVGNYELPGIESLYWLAPEDYLGNLLEAYNGHLRFKVQWVVMRGDTSGSATVGPNVILVGENGVQIAYGDDIYHTSSMAFDIKLNENGWYHLPNNLMDITTRMKATVYKGAVVTRNEFLSVLLNLKRVLLRSSFHTDQIEALLEESILDIGVDVDKYGFGGVEKCSCPSGYSGLSCEKCSFGYVRIYANDSGVTQGFCGKCDCNGHSETCDAVTGDCFCQHNTIGEKCERCAAGFYGNPLHGTKDSCKRCACPLENDENNFSPSCQLDYLDEKESYVCTQCPKGYTGDHCEICDDGYFGNPMEKGNKCQVCDCNGGPCDRYTGQCLNCKGNTEGWKCDKCKPDHYGDPTNLTCKACECDLVGSVSKQCDNVTGQCQCKDRFIGRTCDKCEIGYGNVTGLCAPCQCNSIGSKSEICDSHTGICDCQPGVDGFHCDACQNMFYGFSKDGCIACDCDRDGSISNNCDANGQCICKNNFGGKKCDRCKEKYWLNKNNYSCEQCNCNPDGSLNEICDQSTGQCYCKPGVTGFKCDECKPDYYGSIKTQCKPCDPCNKPGHLCNPFTGKCECPENTEGLQCEKCKPNSWGYEPGLGCKKCKCDHKGSGGVPCDILTGTCTCQRGYEGFYCENCTLGYHRVPNGYCADCNCDIRGSKCANDNICQCKDGQCDCKEYVEGKKCNKCIEHTFGLNKYKPRGCTECFCYGRSKNCQDSKYNWDKIRSTKLDLDVVNCKSRSPCFYLPQQFLGDITTSFGGFITVETQDNFQIFIENPRGITIENYHTKSGNINVKLDENEWRLKFDKNDFMPQNCKSRLSRNCLMLVLQNVQGISIEPPHGEVLNITEVLMDFSSEKLPISHEKYSTVEKCDCPPEYTGLSCQNPSPGYFRTFEKPKNEYEKIIGSAKKCECNGKSEQCDSDTGYCKNCRDNTCGNYCELCAEGFYMDEYEGKCEPCLCPSETENNAKGCRITSTGFECICKEGYKGPNCEECEYGYYRVNGKCERCDCDDKTTTNKQCNPETGKCDCKTGFTGDKCSQCIRPREYVRNGICTPCDECTQILFNKLDDLKDAINETLDQFKDGIGPPWDQLKETMDRHKLLSNEYKVSYEKTQKLLDETDVPSLQKKIDKIEKYVGILKGDKNTENRVDKVGNNVKILLEDINMLDDKVLKVVNNLGIFNKKHVNVSEALEEADEILNDIHEKNLKFSNGTYEKQFKKCEDVYNKIQEVYKDDNISPNRLRELLSQLREKLKDLNKLNEEILRTAPLAAHKNKLNRQRLEELQIQLEEMEVTQEETESNILETKEKLIAASNLLEETKNVYDSLKKIRPDYSKLKKRQLEKGIDYYDYLMDDVDDHLEKLQDTFDHYKNLFNFTKEEMRKINASVAYEEIVRQIKDVNLTAIEARRKILDAVNILEPKNNDSIHDMAVLSQAYSDRLNHRIKNLKDIQPEYNDVKKKVDDLKYNILTNGKKNNDLNAILNNMKNELNNHWDKKQRIEDTITKNENVSEHMQKIVNDVNNMNITIQYNLFQNYKKYLNLFSKDNITDIKNKYSPDLNDVNSEEETAFDALRNIKINKYYIKNTTKTTSDISKSLEKLRGKIMEAKNLANSLIIFLDLTGCVRTYAVPENEIFEKFSFRFKCKKCRPLKLRIGEDDYLRFSAENNEIKVDFNDSHLKFNHSDISEVNVKLVRYGPNLSVKIEKNKSELLGMQTIKDMFKNEESVSEVEVGDINNVGGVLYSMRYNSEAMGLWNFKTTTENSCKGSRDILLVDTIDRLFWNGKGYGIYKTNVLKSISQYALTFNFKTFDENSLLYLSYYDSCNFMSLYIKDRKLHFKWNHLEKTFTLNFPNIVSDGKEHRITIKSLHDSKVQTIKLDLNNETLTEKFYLDKKSIFKFKKANHLVGGVDPSFVKCLAMEETTSFLGELKELSNNIKEDKSYGSSRQEEFKFNKAWFKGKSKLELNFNEKYSYSKLSFLLRPNNSVSNANVMTIENLGRIFIKNENLGIELPNNQFHTIESKLVPNKYHYIEFDVKENVLKVNDAQKNVMFSSNGKLGKINFGDNYIGGFYQLVLDENRAQYLDPKTVMDFKNVAIGREEPFVKKSTKKGRKFSSKIPNEIMQKTESCTSISGTEPVKGAAKFGNKNNSYAKVNLNFNLKKNFVLAFEFRTLYPQGMLIFAEGNRNHYMLVQVDNSRLKMSIQGKKQKNPKINQVDVSNGKWHSVVISLTVVKKTKKMNVTLDGVSHVTKINNANFRPAVFLGGVPENMGINNMNLPQFRGCIKNFSFNGKTHDYQDNKNVGQCFANIETGAYFGGDSYAVYQNNYEINSQFDVTFEFRTSEQNGVLLSISNSQNSPALSIELQNGAVVMAVDMGQNITKESNNLDSEFALCNYKWHSVKTSYSTSELTVKVDGVIKTRVIPGVSDFSAYINAPLYIGGIADSAAGGTLKTRENFKGCIRNVKINNEIKDWTDMYDLHNIMLNSCPTD